METFLAFIHLFTLEQWQWIGIGGSVFFWILGKLSDRWITRYYKRKLERRKLELSPAVQELKRRQQSDPLPPE